MPGLIERFKKLPRVKRLRRRVAASAPRSEVDPDAPRKSRVRILAELAAWERRGGTHRHYFGWGLDRKDAPALDSIFTYDEFAELRDRSNGRPPGGRPLAYTLVLDDKLHFALFVEAMGHPAPRTIAVANARSITWLHPRRTAPLSSLLAPNLTVDVVCKDILGEQGDGLFRLHVKDGLLRINEDVAPLDALAARLASPCILQRRLVQHPGLSAVHPHSINTFRLITIRSEGRVQHFSYPVLRVGSGGSIVDNISQGGILARIDRATGRVAGPGLWHGGEIRSHPDSGVVFDGLQLPYFHKAADLAIRIHEDLPRVHSVGWDMAVAPEGPVVIEGNSNWSAENRITGEPEFRRQFTRLCSAAPARR